MVIKDYAFQLIYIYSLHLDKVDMLLTINFMLAGVLSTFSIIISTSQVLKLSSQLIFHDLENAHTKLEILDLSI